MADHLDFDTDFLNNPTSKKPTPPSGGAPEGGGKKNLWTIGAVIVGVILVVIAIDSSDTSSTYTPPPTPVTTQDSGDHSFEYNGQTFSCSDYHYDKAIALRPDVSLGTQIDTEGTLLDSRISAMEAEGTRVENMYVDEYDQYSIDAYNQAIDSYNFKKNRLGTDIDNWNSRNEAFNAKIDIYNNYLDANCRPQ